MVVLLVELTGTGFLFKESFPGVLGGLPLTELVLVVVVVDQSRLQERVLQLKLDPKWLQTYFYYSTDTNFYYVQV